MAFTCYYRSGGLVMVQFIACKMPALLYPSFKPWVNLQKFLRKEGALWLPSVDELIIFFSLYEPEFVSFLISYFLTYNEIWIFAKVPKQRWATRSPLFKHTDHTLFVPIRYQNGPILISPHWTRFGILGSTPPSAGKKSYRRADLAVKGTSQKIWSVIVSRQEEITVIVSYQSGHLVRNERRPKATPLGLTAWVRFMTGNMTMLVC